MYKYFVRAFDKQGLKCFDRTSINITIHHANPDSGLEKFN
jgi:hypothetical protein